GDLAQGKIRITPVVTTIHNLDANRAGIDVLLSCPGRGTGMPGAACFRNTLYDAAVLEHDVVRRHFGTCGAELPDRPFDVWHTGVVQHDHVGRATAVPFAEVRRRDNVRHN